MRAIILTGMLFAGCLRGFSQQPVAVVGTTPQEVKKPDTSSSIVYKSDLDFTYTYSVDWEVLDTEPMMPVARMQGEDKAESDPEKRAAQCVQIGLMLKRGTPSSVIIALSLPWDCLGKSYKTSDLPAFGGGVAKGILRSYDAKEPVYGAYKLGAHDFWIERTVGAGKDHPENVRTLEIACVLLKKGALCMMGLLKDDVDLNAFESATLSIEGDAPAQLVPANVFASHSK